MARSNQTFNEFLDYKAFEKWKNKYTTSIDYSFIPNKETLQASNFHKSTAGALYRTKIHDAVDRLVNWCESQKIEVNYEIIKSFKELFNKRVDLKDIAFYTEGMKQFLAIVNQCYLPLDAKQAPLGVKKLIIGNLIKQIGCCIPGIYTHIDNAYNRLQTDIAAVMQAIRNEIAGQIAQEIIREDESSDPMMEIHDVNALLSVYKEELAIDVVNDSYAENFVDDREEESRVEAQVELKDQSEDGEVVEKVEEKVEEDEEKGEEEEAEEKEKEEEDEEEAEEEDEIEVENEDDGTRNEMVFKLAEKVKNKFTQTFTPMTILNALNQRINLAKFIELLKELAALKSEHKDNAGLIKEKENELEFINTELNFFGVDPEWGIPRLLDEDLLMDNIFEISKDAQQQLNITLTKRLITSSVFKPDIYADPQKSTESTVEYFLCEEPKLFAASSYVKKRGEILSLPLYLATAEKISSNEIGFIFKYLTISLSNDPLIEFIMQNIMRLSAHVSDDVEIRLAFWNNVLNTLHNLVSVSSGYTKVLLSLKSNLSEQQYLSMLNDRSFWHFHQSSSHSGINLENFLDYLEIYPEAMRFNFVNGLDVRQLGYILSLNYEAFVKIFSMMNAADKINLQNLLTREVCIAVYHNNRTSLSISEWIEAIGFACLQDIELHASDFFKHNLMAEFTFKDKLDYIVYKLEQVPVENRLQFLNDNYNLSNNYRSLKSYQTLYKLIKLLSPSQAIEFFRQVKMSSFELRVILNAQTPANELFGLLQQLNPGCWDPNSSSHPFAFLCLDEGDKVKGDIYKTIIVSLPREQVLAFLEKTDKNYLTTWLMADSENNIPKSDSLEIVTKALDEKHITDFVRLLDNHKPLSNYVYNVRCLIAITKVLPQAHCLEFLLRIPQEALVQFFYSDYPKEDLVTYDLFWLPFEKLGNQIGSWIRNFGWEKLQALILAPNKTMGARQVYFVIRAMTNLLPREREEFGLLETIGFDVFGNALCNLLKNSDSKFWPSFPGNNNCKDAILHFYQSCDEETKNRLLEVFVSQVNLVQESKDILTLTRGVIYVIPNPVKFLEKLNNDKIIQMFDYVHELHACDKYIPNDSEDPEDIPLVYLEKHIFVALADYINKIGPERARETLLVFTPERLKTFSIIFNSLENPDDARQVFQFIFEDKEYIKHNLQQLINECMHDTRALLKITGFATYFDIQGLNIPAKILSAFNRLTGDKDDDDAILEELEEVESKELLKSESVASGYSNVSIGFYGALFGNSISTGVHSNDSNAAILDDNNNNNNNNGAASGDNTKHNKRKLEKEIDFISGFFDENFFASEESEDEEQQQETKRQRSEKK